MSGRIPCTRADDVAAYLLYALDADEARGFEAHMHECEACRHDLELLRVASDALPTASPMHPAPPALKERIMAIVEQEAAVVQSAERAAVREPQAAPEATPAVATPAAAVAPPAAAAPAASEPAIGAAGTAAAAPRPRPRRRRRDRRFSLAGFSLRPAFAVPVTAMLVAFGIVVGLLVSGGSPGLEPRDVRAQTVDGIAYVQIAEDSSRLVVSGMNAPPPGRQYQVWLMRAGSTTPEPTDVLFEPRSGSASVPLPSLRDVDQVLVTHEPIGGSRAPTVDPVITAPLTT